MGILGSISYVDMVILAGILFLGILAQWVSWRVRVPAIFPLILIGLIVGPIASSDFFLGHKIIDPSKVFPDSLLNAFVTLSVGIILFEGGLTLRFKEVKQVASTVRNLVVFGPMISLLGGGLAAYHVLGLSIEVALLFGALIIVTGPTVIAPILRNVHANPKVATVLKWESIVIDPVGALVAVIIYEFVASGAGANFTGTALITFGQIIGAGSLMGFVGGFGLYFALKRKLIPEYLVNVVSLAVVVCGFTLSETLASESGLLAVTVMGMTLANMKLPEIREILNFKESLTVLLVSILFIVLSAKIDLAQLELLGVNSLIVLGIVIFILRPISVFLCALGSNLTLREKIFISWIGPRGIVAAAIASIFSIQLMQASSLTEEIRDDAALLLPLTFLIILGTVVLQGLSAKPIAKLLGVTRRNSTGYLLLGAHEAGRTIARYLKDNGYDVTLVDTSHTNINACRLLGLRVIESNILAEELTDELELLDLGVFLGLTSNNELNILSCRRMKNEAGTTTNYRLITRNEMRFNNLVRPKYILFGNQADFYRLIDLARKHPLLCEVPLASKQHLRSLLDDMKEKRIPIFIKSKTGRIQVIPAHHQIEFSEGDMLVYLGEDLLKVDG